MKLKVLRLIYKGQELYKQYPGNEFMGHSEFIWHYLSTRVKKLKIEMAHPFQEIIVDAGNEFETYIYNKRLLIPASFDLEKFEAAEKAGSIDYYLELFEEGLEKVKEGWGVPYVEIKKLIEEGKKAGFPNRMALKTLLLDDCDLKAEFIQYFTRNEIAVDAAFSKISTGEALCQGHLFRSAPDTRFYGFVKYISAGSGRIRIGFEYENENDLGHFDISEILNGRYEFHYGGTDGMDVYDAQWFGWCKYNLNYIGDGFYWEYPLEPPLWTMGGILANPDWLRDIYLDTPSRIQTVARPL